MKFDIDRIKKITAFIPIIVVTSYIIILLVKGIDIIEEVLSNYALLGGIVFSLIVVVYIVLVAYKNVIGIIIGFIKIVTSFFIGNYQIMRKLEKFKRPIDTFIENNISLFASRYLFMDKIKSSNGTVKIYFSHRGEYPHNRVVAARESSAIPLILEESNMIMKCWSIAVNCLGIKNVQLSCSCEENFSYDDYRNECETDERNPKLPENLYDNLILFGSSSTNVITKIILDRATKVNEKIWTFRETTAISRYDLYNASEHTTLVSSTGYNNKPNNDYALITRMKNPFAPDKFVFIFAGCRSAGALAVEYFFLNNDVLERILKEYYDKVPFQIILKVEYTYCANPPLPEFVHNSRGFVEFEILYPKDLMPCDQDNKVKIDKEIIENMRKRYLI